MTSSPTGTTFINPVAPGHCRKQEELVYSVRKRLEEALMADMLAHVEEAASDGEALKEEGNGSEDMESV